MKLIRNSIPGFFYIATLVLLSVMMLAIFSHEYRVYDYYFNPDSLYLPSLYRGLFIDGYPLKSFHLNPSVLLVPDVILYFPLIALTGDTILSSFLFSIIQHLLIFGFILLIFNRLFTTYSLLAGAVANILFLIFFLGAILSREILFAAFSLVSTNHVGAFVMMLLCLWLLLKYLRKPGIGNAITLVLLVFLSVFSDRLFILMFPVPVILVFVLQSIVAQKWQRAVPVLMILSSTIAAYFFHEFADGAFFYLAKLPEISTWNNILPAFNLMMADLWEFTRGMDAHTLLIIGSTLSFFTQTFVVLHIIKTREFNSTLGFYLTFSVFYIFIIFWMPVITGSYVAKHILRYNISAFYLAMINIPVLAVYFLKKKDFNVRRVFNRAVATGLIMMFSIGVSHLSKKGIREFFNYYPDFVRELDEIAEHEDFQNGVANFWNAKPITLFSKKGLRVYHAYDNLYPYFHVIGRYYFIGKSETFNFAVISSFTDKKAYKQYLGENGKVIKNGGTEVVILPTFRYNQKTGWPYFIGKKEPLHKNE